MLSNLTYAPPSGGELISFNISADADNVANICYWDDSGKHIIGLTTSDEKISCYGYFLIQRTASSSTSMVRIESPDDKFLDYWSVGGNMSSCVWMTPNANNVCCINVQQYLKEHPGIIIEAIRVGYTD